MYKYLHSTGAFVTHRFPSLRRLVHSWKDGQRLVKNPIKPTVHGFNFGGNESMISGEFEGTEVVVMDKILESADVFVDIGANIGLYSCLALKRSKKCIAFEPLQSNLSVLYKNISANNWSDEIEVFPMGISDEKGLLEIFGRDTGASLVKDWRNNQGLIGDVIPVNTLDNVISNRFSDENIVLKIDVEGVERAVLTGAKKVIGSNPNMVIFVEISLDDGDAGENTEYRSTFELLWGLNFEVYSIEGEKVSPSTVSKWVDGTARAWSCANWIAFGPSYPNETKNKVFANNS